MPPPPPPDLPDDLLGEAFLRLPPNDPACLLRASLVCKRWRRILADPAFRRRHRELYPGPSVVGFIQVVGDRVPYCSRFVPGNPASGRPARRDIPGWLAVDCRHGRALFVTPATGQDIGEVREEEVNLDFVVWDPLTDERRRLPPPSPPPHRYKLAFNAAVLCAAASGTCDHRGCHGGPFRVVFVFTTTTYVASTGFVTSASMYSSETGVWSGLTSVQHPHAAVGTQYPSALVGDTLYFRARGIFAFESQMYDLEYQLGAQRLSMIDRWPAVLPRLYMASVDGKLGFFNVEKEPNLSLCLWSHEIDPNGVAQWVRDRVIKLRALLPSDAFLPPPPNDPRINNHPSIVGFAEGTDVILLAMPARGLHWNVYMAKLNSGRAKKIIEGLGFGLGSTRFYPYTSYCIPVPVIDSGSTGEGLKKGISGV